LIQRSLDDSSRRRGLQPDEERVSELLGMLQSKMDAYDLILSKQKYLAGDVHLIYFFTVCAMN
jgi:glutathione S-transferase